MLNTPTEYGQLNIEMLEKLDKSVSELSDITAQCMLESKLTMEGKTLFALCNGIIAQQKGICLLLRSLLTDSGSKM